MNFMSGYRDRRIYFNDFTDNNLYKYGYNANIQQGYDMTGRMLDNNYIREYSNSPNSVDRNGSLSYITPYAPVLKYQLIGQKIVSPLQFNNLMTQSSGPY